MLCPLDKLPGGRICMARVRYLDEARVRGCTEHRRVRGRTYSCRWADSAHPRGHACSPAAAVAAARCPRVREVRVRRRDRARWQRALPAGGTHPSVEGAPEGGRWRVPGPRRAAGWGSWCRWSRVAVAAGAANVGWNCGVEVRELRDWAAAGRHIGPTCRAEGWEAEREAVMRLAVLGLRIEAAQAKKAGIVIG
jgi:hypothetical protein